MQLDKPYKTPFIGEKSHMDKIGRKKVKTDTCQVLSMGH